MEGRSKIPFARGGDAGAAGSENLTFFSSRSS